MSKSLTKIQTNTNSLNKSRFYSPVSQKLTFFTAPKTPKDRALLAQHFPVVDPIVTPLSNRIIVQLKSPLKKSMGGLHMHHKDEIAQLWNEQVARVIAIGPSAFQFQRDGKAWPEGEGYDVGDFVLVPTHRADRWEAGEKESVAYFVMLRDYEVMARIHGNPLAIDNKSIGGVK
jgi:co-chaperonin GroES (HSP10)